MWKGSSPSWSRMLLLLLLVGSFASCVTKKQIARAKKEYVYLQTGLDSLQSIPKPPQARIRPYVDLSISVITPALQKEQLDVFGNGRPVDYKVDSLGQINFPLAGRLKLKGMTAMEASSLIENKLKNYVKDPFVQIKFEGFNISVTGEVTKPGFLSLRDESPTIFNALSSAGYANYESRRDSILILRQTDEGLYKYYVDIRDAKSVFVPEHYYLHPNDLVVVGPSDKAIKSYLLRTQQQDITTLQRYNLLVSMVFFLIPIVNLFINNR